MIRRPPRSTPFPTRRSSDLGVPILIKDNVETSDHMMSTAGSLALTGWYAPHDAPLVERPRRADRKSTRLNSSHANIPYAVFCLKKKRQLEISPKPSHPPDL